MTEASPIVPAGGPLELLFDASGVPRVALPSALAACYGGELGFSAPCLYANFVSSVDGVVALRSAEESGGVISGHSEADRFVMGLLRACADAVLIGAGTFRKAASHLWHAEHVYPAAATHFALLRRRLSLLPQPLLVIVSASGELSVDHPAFQHPTLIVTTPRGKARLSRGLPPQVRFLVTEAAPIPFAPILDALRGEQLGNVLSEGGPSLIGSLVREGLLDELFLTSSPVLLGRRDGDGRKTLVEGVDVLGRASARLELLSVRRHLSHLFLRYRALLDLRGPATAPAGTSKIG